jgi:hypothetical protein
MEFIYAKNTQLYGGDSPILLRGFGLGGWLLPEGYMWKLFTKCDRPRRMEEMIMTLCGQSYSEYFWDAYYNHYITERDIEWIAEKGFNSVRIPLNSRNLYNVSHNGLAFDTKTINRLDQIIQWCKKNDIYTILDMHGAPGGQTGANIDDSESDLPELFMNKDNAQILIELWRMLADRYKDEPAVAGYDLLNEPLPNWFSQYNDKLMPLYMEIIDAIRTVDSKHLIILEGLHWSTDFSIFESIPTDHSLEGIVLEFHKYWSNPDKESLKEFIDVSRKLKFPLFMGEGGENNKEWYTTIFPLYERLGISWSFWSYKKMECNNSPITFDMPQKWNLVVSWLDQENKLDPQEAKEVFNEFLYNIKHSAFNDDVICALDRRVPVLIPAEAYDAYEIYSERIEGASLRLSDPVSILFESGKTGEVDYKRYGGESQPDDENLVVLLNCSDSVSYNFKSDFDRIIAKIHCDGDGILKIIIHNKIYTKRVFGAKTFSLEFDLKPNMDETIKINCTFGSVKLDTIHIVSE